MAQANVFADLCDIVELMKYYTYGDKNYEEKIMSGVTLISRESKRIAEMCGDVYNDIFQIVE